jgi:hypothetical protein
MLYAIEKCHKIRAENVTDDQSLDGFLDSLQSHYHILELRLAARR